MLEMTVQAMQARRKNHVYHFMRLLTSSYLQAKYGTITYEGLEHLVDGKGAFLLSNHWSWEDIPVQAMALWSVKRKGLWAQKHSIEVDLSRKIPTTPGKALGRAFLEYTLKGSGGNPIYRPRDMREHKGTSMSGRGIAAEHNDALYRGFAEASNLGEHPILFVDNTRREKKYEETGIFFSPHQGVITKLVEADMNIRNNGQAVRFAPMQLTYVAGEKRKERTLHVRVFEPLYVEGNTPCVMQRNLTERLMETIGNTPYRELKVI